MTFKKNFVAVVKSKGKVLRERNGVVNVPFGSEYSLLFKNLESRKAIVNVDVDGEDALDGQSLIVQPNSTSELQGFLNGRKATNRFRFIEKTKEISDYRGDRIDDGVIRVEFRHEKEEAWPCQATYYYYPHWFVGVDLLGRSWDSGSVGSVGSGFYSNCDTTTCCFCDNSSVTGL
jgi:hypothetical protein